MTIEPVGVDGVDAERLFEALAHERRQHVLAVLRDDEESASLSELAVAVARRETEEDVDPERETVERVHTSLYHWHVPKLADANLVEYDVERGTVAPAQPAIGLEEGAELLAIAGE